MPSRALAIFSPKKRCHSASVKLIWLRASSWTRRLFTRAVSVVELDVFVALSFQLSDELPFQVSFALVAVSAVGAGRHSETTVASEVEATML